MFVIFLLTQPSAIFARCGLLPATDMIAPSCCPLPSQSPPPLAPPLPSPPPLLSTIEAAHLWCALSHPTPQPLSAAAVHSCCVPSLPHRRCRRPQKKTAHRWCTLPHPTPQPPSAATVPRLCAVAAANAVAIVPQPPSTLPATVHICCAPLLPQLPLPSSKSALPQCNVCCSWYFNKNR